MYYGVILTMESRFRIFRTALATCLAVLFLTASVANTYGGVWCVEKSGSARLEIACNPCCSDADDQCATEDAAESGDEHPGCGDCSDIPVDELVKSRRSTNRFLARTMALGWFSDIVNSESATLLSGDSLPLPPLLAPQPRATQATLEAVVLRC